VEAAAAVAAVTATAASLSAIASHGLAGHWRPRGGVVEEQGEISAVRTRIIVAQPTGVPPPPGGGDRAWPGSAPGMTGG
jgi:hypothetical protein